MLPLFEIASQSAAVRVLLGEKPVRFFPFGEAPQNVRTPYGVWQLVSGVPENKLAGEPDEDTYTVQIDAYADSGAQARAVGAALRDSLESSGYVVSYNGEGKETDTRLFRFSFSMDLMVDRNWFI